MRVNPASTRLVLEYVGDGRPISGVPARDLTEHDLARLTHKRSLSVVNEVVGQPVDPKKPKGPKIERPDPLKPNARLAQTIYDELVGTGQFKSRYRKPAKPKKDKPKTTARRSDLPTAIPLPPPTEAPSVGTILREDQFGG
jgi:hypothetical protein